jgi:large-conductance mechanosensitive channel
MLGTTDLFIFLAKNGLPILAAGETLGKVAADFVDVLVNDLFMPGVYQVSKAVVGDRLLLKESFKDVKQNIQMVSVLAATLKFFLAVVAVYIVLGIMLNKLANFSKV